MGKYPSTRPFCFKIMIKQNKRGNRHGYTFSYGYFSSYANSVFNIYIGIRIYMDNDFSTYGNKLDEGINLHEKNILYKL